MYNNYTNAWNENYVQRIIIEIYSKESKFNNYQIDNLFKYFWNYITNYNTIQLISY